MGQTKQARSRFTARCPRCNESKRLAIYTVSDSIQRKACACGDWYVHVEPFRGTARAHWYKTEGEAFASLARPVEPGR